MKVTQKLYQTLTFLQIQFIHLFLSFLNVHRPHFSISLVSSVTQAIELDLRSTIGNYHAHQLAYMCMVTRYLAFPFLGCMQKLFIRLMFRQKDKGKEHKGGERKICLLILDGCCE